MKKLYLTICLMLFCIIMQNANCQNSVAISEHAIWCTYFELGCPPTDYWYIYKTSGDTIINSTNYIKLYSASAHRNGFDSYSQDSPFGYSCAFRNDTNNRAYIFPANDSIEHLWYDFNLSVGDTLPENPKWYSTKFLNTGDNIIVTSIDSIAYCNKYYKRYVFNTMFPNLVREAGFTGDLIGYNGIYFEYAVSLEFFCTDTLISNCCFTITGIQDFDKSTSDILISPNPVKDNLTVETPEKATIEILNTQGQIIKIINTAEKQTTIDLRNLSSGVYIIKAKTDKRVAVKKFIKE